MSRGVVASDSVRNRFDNKKPDGVATVSVAVAVSDISEFNESYESVIREFQSEHGVTAPHPIIKDQDITRWVPNWAQETARRDLVTELLAFDSLETIQITETSLDNQWIHMYERDRDGEQLPSSAFVNNVLSSYYNIVSIWKYLKNGGDRSRPTPNRLNVITDDFSGKTFPAWEEVSQQVEQLNVVPQGDVTYPLLSFADLLMGLLKQEVNPLYSKSVYEFLKERTDAYVDADTVKNVSKLVPSERQSIRQELYYPKPTVYVDKGGMPKDKLTSLDVFLHACRYAYQNEGCVKFFEESHDRDFLQDGDVIVTLGNNRSYLEDYRDLNTEKSVQVKTRDEVIDFLLSELS